MKIIISDIHNIPLFRNLKYVKYINNLYFPSNKIFRISLESLQKMTKSINICP